MRMDHVTAFLYALKPLGIRFGLENVRLVLETLGCPQNRFRVIHVAGSNGKGSTCAFLDSMLRAAGHKVGLYTSPHLIHFRERFCIQGSPVQDEAIERNMERLITEGLQVDLREVERFIEQEDLPRRMEQGTWYQERGSTSQFTRMTFFECTTVLAVLLFAEAKLDVCVMETGMGGRLDATNVFSPLVSVITPIHLEHTAWLGKTIAAIASEKAGIVKAGVPVVSARQQSDARQVIEQTAGEKGAPLSLMGRDFDARGGWREARFQVSGEEYGPIRLGLCGNHQMQNAAAALACLPLLQKAGIAVSKDAAERGLASVNWPGRFERFRKMGKGTQWVLDGAHNPDGARVLADTVRDVFHGDALRLLFGVLKDKEVEKMLPTLLPLAGSIRLVHPSDVRGRDPRELLPLLDQTATCFETVWEAMEALEQDPGPPVLVTGSLVVVGEARSWLLSKGYFSISGEDS
jgi:dihydrofolate synthase / folylpolyglutamate synthase